MDRVGYAYKLLGISVDAPLSDVTRAYRQLAKKYHPDSNPGSKNTDLTMMMRINEAYETVKNHIAQVSEEANGSAPRSSAPRPAAQGSQREAPRQDTRTTPRQDHFQRASRPDPQKQARERLQREREAVNQFWEHRFEERRREREDLNSFRTFGTHLFQLISDFYEKRLHYEHVRSRPQYRIAFEEFLGKYEVLIERSEKLSRTARSKEYRKRFRLSYEFILLFLDHIQQRIPTDAERRASTLQQFNEALNSCDHFLSGFFDDLQFDQEQIVSELKRVLNDFEEFITAYPDSPLMDYADSTVDVLHSLYRAFLKG
jgi:curved DNA-binding protein CbpA